MHRPLLVLPLLVLLSSAPSAADAVVPPRDPTRSLGISFAFAYDALEVLQVELEGGIALDRELWAIGGLAFGIAQDTDGDPSSAYAGRAGVMYLQCRDVLCIGGTATVGYLLQSIDLPGDFGRPEVTVRRHAVLGDGRLVLRLRTYGRHAALQASFGIRVSVTTVNECPFCDNNTAGPAGSLGLLVAF